MISTKPIWKITVSQSLCWMIIIVVTFMYMLKKAFGVLHDLCTPQGLEAVAPRWTLLV